MKSYLLHRTCCLHFDGNYHLTTCYGRAYAEGHFAEQGATGGTAPVAVAMASHNGAKS